jgi:hypothetical protein
MKESAKAEIKEVSELPDQQQLCSAEEGIARESSRKRLKETSTNTKGNNRKVPTEEDVTKLVALEDRIQKLGFNQEKLIEYIGIVRSTYFKYKNREKCDCRRNIEKIQKCVEEFGKLNNKDLTTKLGSKSPDSNPEAAKESNKSSLIIGNAENTAILPGDTLSHLAQIQKQGVDQVIPVNQLEHSEYSHTNCMSKVRNKLWIAGVLARKWTKDEHRAQFRKCLFRLGKEEARFLLILPETEIYESLREAKPGENNSHSLNELKKIMVDFKNLRVKLTPFRPQNRLMFINGGTLIFSRYDLLETPSSSDYLVIKTDIDISNPLYCFFEDYYKELWESKDLVDLEEVKLPNDF